MKASKSSWGLSCAVVLLVSALRVPPAFATVNQTGIVYGRVVSVDFVRGAINVEFMKQDKWVRQTFFVVWDTDIYRRVESLESDHANPGLFFMDLFEVSPKSMIWLNYEVVRYRHVARRIEVMDRPRSLQ